ncbi:hypothetical protein ABPG72_004781 [Tetrahymena utriculariae]
MSKIVKPNSKLQEKVKKFKINEASEDKDTNEEDDDIQNFEHLDVQKQKKIQNKKQATTSSSSNYLLANQKNSKLLAQDVSFSVDESDEELAIPNQPLKHAFKKKIRNSSQSSSSDRDEFANLKSNQGAAQKNAKQSNGKKINNSKGFPAVNYANQQDYKSAPDMKDSTKCKTKEISSKQDMSNLSKIFENNKLIDKPQKKIKRDTFQSKIVNEEKNYLEEERSNSSDKNIQTAINNKENLKNGSLSNQNQKVLSNSNQQNLNLNIKPSVKALFFEENEDMAANNKQVEKKDQDQNIPLIDLEVTDGERKNISFQKEEKQRELEELVIDEKISKGYPSVSLKKLKQENRLNYSLDSFSNTDDLSIQAQGSNSSQMDIRSINQVNMLDAGDNDSILCNYSHIDEDQDQNYSNLIGLTNNNLNNSYMEDEEDELFDNIKIKKKSNAHDILNQTSDVNKQINANMRFNHSNSHKSGISSDSSLQVHQKSPLKQPARNSFSPIENMKKDQQNNMHSSNFSHSVSANQLNTSSYRKKDAKGQQRVSSNQNKMSFDYQKGELQNISNIEEELFEVNELPKEKTRILWIFNSVHFIERLTNNEHFLEGQEITTQNGKKWILQISYNEKLQQIECVFSRQNKEDTSKQQFYYLFKFYALSQTESIIDKSYNGNKTFSIESLSQSFNFPLDIELILEKYQHIIFELTLTPNRLQFYNSKVETNYVGLLNEGQTCYMNSYLQTLFHIKAFVKLVYSIPTDKESEPVFPNSLQVLFYQLQSRQSHCTTTELLKSFQWDKSKARIQQDVQEFSCLFIEYLESKAEKIPQLKGQIKHLFQGKIQNYIKCINVEYESVKEESFFEISLNLKGCKNIYESLDDYVKEELLEKDNKYDTGDVRYQKQDAKKGIKILELPPILFFHLKRFQFDYQTGRNVKIVDQHQYYEEIDMRKYIANPTKDECYKYQLFAVLVHSGDFSSSGHYYAYIRPNPKQNNWFKFNDSIVEKSSKRQALDYLFGGKVFFKGFDKSKKQLAYENMSINSTAYMLVYINKREINNILADIPKENVPKWVIDQEDQLIQNDLLKQKLSRIVQVRITSFDLLKKQQQTCGVYFQKQTKRDEQPEVNESIIYKKEVDKNKTFKEFFEELCSEIGVEPEDLGIWKIDYLPNSVEKLTNQIKKLVTHGQELIEKVYLENFPSSQNYNTTSNQNQYPAPIFLIIPISTSKFVGNKQIFQQGPHGQIEIKKLDQTSSNGEKRMSSQNDWNRYFQFQEGTLMLIIIKSFEYTKEGVKIQFIDYIYYNPLSTFSQLAEEIIKKKRIDMCSFQFFKEESYNAQILSVEVNGQTHLKNVFNSTDCGVIIISYESKLSKENNISIQSYYQQLEDQVRVRFMFSSNPLSVNAVSANISAATSPFQNIQQNANKLNNQQNTIVNNYFNETASNQNKINTTQIDPHQFLKNFQLNSLLPNEGISFDKIFLKTIKYSQLQISLFNSLKDYFREQIKQYYSYQGDSPNSLESEEVVKSSNFLTNPKKLTQNLNIQAIEQFINLDESFHEYILFKCKIRKRNIEEIPFYQSSVSETSLQDLFKHFDNTIILHFDFSKSLRAKDRDQKLVIEYILYSNSFNKIYAHQVIDIDKTANMQTLGNLLKQQKFFKEYMQAEQVYAQKQGIIPPSNVKVCQLSRDNPNRIELYYTESTKLNTIKKNQLIRVELHQEIKETEILYICHQTTKNGVEAFDNPFSFPLSIYWKVKELKNKVVQILTDRQVIYDGKKVEVNKDNLQIILYSEYSKYDSSSLQVEDSNEKQIKHEIDIDSFKNKCGYLEIQHTSLLSSTDNKAIKFDIN